MVPVVVLLGKVAGLLIQVDQGPARPPFLGAFESLVVDTGEGFLPLGEDVEVLLVHQVSATFQDEGVVEIVLSLFVLDSAGVVPLFRHRVVDFVFL